MLITRRISTGDRTRSRCPLPSWNSISRELEQLHCEPQPTSGQNAKTLAKYDDFRIVLTALKAHTRIPGHRTEGRISIHTVQGHIRLRALGRTFDLRAGCLLTLDQGLPHDVEALEDSAFLLTIAWPVGDGGRTGQEQVGVSRRAGTGQGVDRRRAGPGSEGT